MGLRVRRPNGEDREYQQCGQQATRCLRIVQQNLERFLATGSEYDTLLVSVPVTIGPARDHSHFHVARDGGQQRYRIESKSNTKSVVVPQHLS